MTSQSRESASTTDFHERRCQKAFLIMEELNKTKRQGGEYFFDCGSMGTLRIWWSKFGWYTEWIVISKEFINL